MLDIFLGVLLGYISGTITESFGHKFFGHPRHWQRRLYKKYPQIFSAFLKPLNQHLVIHHGKTYKKSIFEQFSSDSNKTVVDNWVRASFSKGFSQLIWLERYNLTLRGISGTLPFALPFFLGPLAIAIIGGPWFFLGSMLTAFLPVWCSKYVHPLIHHPEETRFAPWHARLYMKSWVGSWAFKNHFLHHKFPEFNFNLIPGGDYIIGLYKSMPKSMEKEFQAALMNFKKRIYNYELVAEENMDLQKLRSDYLALKNPSHAERFKLQAEFGKYTVAHPNCIERMEDLKLARNNYSYRQSDRKSPEFSQWIENPIFEKGAYEKSREGNTLFRGIEFRTGDLVLMNLESDSDGIYSTLSDQRISFAHVGLFVEVTEGEKTFPAIVEMNRFGITSTPLKVALSDRFIGYAEVFRPKEGLNSEQEKIVIQASKRFCRKAYSFDFWQNYRDSSVMTCAKLVFLILTEAGVKTPKVWSKYHQKTKTNLELLGIGETLGWQMLMPDDYTHSDDFSIIGFLDNGCYDQLVSRALARFRFQNIWREEVLNPKNYPLKYLFSRWVVAHVQKEGFLSDFLFKRVIKMRKEHFPSGPLSFVSLAPFAEKTFMAMTRQIHKDLQGMKPKWAFKDWQTLLAEPEIQALTKNADHEWRSFFAKTRKQAKVESSSVCASHQLS